MARTFAAVMALIGMQVTLLRAMKDGAGFEGTITTALAWMALFGAIGMVVGAIAQQTVDESVRTMIEAEFATVSSENEATTKTTI
ncbi:MAG: hypothetical protein GXP28_03090 [Planctomycetes bacterium]|nr:hypothetical protein [Planctomycetota bacterium]